MHSITYCNERARDCIQSEFRRDIAACGMVAAMSCSDTINLSHRHDRLCGAVQII